MADSARLLQMLEPAVRPVAAPSAVRPAQPVPFERRSFDDLLAEYGGQTEGASAGTPVAATPGEAATPAKPPPALDLGRVENASLRAMIAQRTAPTAQDPTTAERIEPHAAARPAESQ